MDANFSIKINDKGGIPYRDYTDTTLRKLFLESKTGVNFELMSLVVHNWLNFKNPLNSGFKDYSYDEALGQLSSLKSGLSLFRKEVNL